MPSDFTNFDKAIEKQSFYDELAIRIDEEMIAIDLDRCVKNGDNRAFPKGIYRI